MKVIVDTDEMKKYGHTVACLLGYLRIVGDKLMTYEEIGNETGISAQYVPKLTNQLIKDKILTRYSDGNKVYSFEVDESKV